MSQEYKYSLNGSPYSNFVIPPLEKEVNIAIIQPGSWGDNINSTMMLMPLKGKYPNSQIDIYSTKNYQNAFYNNPLISNIIAADIDGKNDSLNFVHIYPDLLKDKYQIVINASPFINPNDWSSGLYPHLGENLMLSWCKALEKINVHYSLPLTTLLFPTEQERDKVLSWIQNNIRDKNKRKALLEVEGESGQSFWNPDWTKETVKTLANLDIISIISKKHLTSEIQELIKLYPNKVLFCGDLTIRECSILYNNCDIFFSISSGLSNACNTQFCTRHQIWIETVNSEVPSSKPLRDFGKKFWHKNNLKEFINYLIQIL